MSKFYRTGRVAPKNLKHLKQLSLERHGATLRSLPVANETTWDSRKNGWVGAIKDQGNCGSCWDFSGTGVSEIAFNVAGVGGGPTKLILSEEYTLSCGNNGGCNGDDNTTVLEWAKTTGLPLTAAYGSYEGEADSCNYSSSMKLYKINDWGYADTNNENSVGDTQAIKNAIKAYGCVGSGIAADDDFMNNPAGTVYQGDGSTDIDHDIILIGWDDSKGAWLLRNSWGTDWCDEGYCWILYGANAVGTEAVFATVTNPNPPAPPTPVPTPTPTPVPVPTPTPAPVPVPNDLQTDMDQLFTDIKSRFSDNNEALILLNVVQFLLDAYVKGLS